MQLSGSSAVSMSVVHEAETSLVKEPGTFGDVFDDVLQYMSFLMEHKYINKICVSSCFSHYVFSG